MHGHAAALDEVEDNTVARTQLPEKR